MIDLGEGCHKPLAAQRQMIWKTCLCSQDAPSWYFSYPKTRRCGQAQDIWQERGCSGLTSWSELSCFCFPQICTLEVLAPVMTPSRPKLKLLASLKQASSKGNKEGYDT
mmetsp:Transcript_64340/g.122746  ORF Transcript_64340/g.122746 Transcript_64340/m.122746 type:complete len:109 (+) Transcript_64340:165-491(+)